MLDLEIIYILVVRKQHRRVFDGKHDSTRIQLGRCALIRLHDITGINSSRFSALLAMYELLKILRELAMALSMSETTRLSAQFTA